jgi:hypothetical protein
VHSYLVTVEHTARLRERIGADTFLTAEQAVVIGDPASAGKPRTSTSACTCARPTT